MKWDKLFQESFKGLGMRFSLVSVLPTIVLFLFLLALFWSGALKNVPDIEKVVTKIDNMKVTDFILLGIVVLAFSLVLHPLQISLTRIFEGYWGNSWFARKLSQFGVDRQKRRIKPLNEPLDKLNTNDVDDLTDEELKHIKRCAWKFHQFYPREDRLLPTKLGNVLRAAEDNAGEQYGLDAVVIWPRLYPLLSRETKSVVVDRRNQLDLAVRFCANSLIAALISAIVLMPHGWWLLIPLSTLVLAWLCYRSAIVSALGYGESIRIAIDLHRFDMLKALHLPLPIDDNEERMSNKALCDFLRQGIPANFRYHHEPSIGENNDTEGP